MLRLELGAEAGGRQPLVVGLKPKVPEVEFRGSLVRFSMPLQRQPRLTRGVVEYQLAVAAGPVLAGFHVLALQTG